RHSDANNTNTLYATALQILEIIALIFVIKLLFSHCVLAGEYGISVWFYIYFLPGITIHTLILALFRLCWSTVGLDPIAVAYNLVSGILLIVATLILLFALISHCGNEFAYMFFISSACGLVAGILHLANGIMCLYYMPSEE
ncbi:hypothetical protein KR222_009965, partial [Zaprionus bogoriensis]